MANDGLHKRIIQLRHQRHIARLKRRLVDLQRSGLQPLYQDDIQDIKRELERLKR